MSFLISKACNQAIVALAVFLSSSLLQANALAESAISPPTLPLTFEQNRGQAADSGVKFISRAASGILFLSDDEISLREPGKAAEFRLRVLGASAMASILGTGERSGSVNYLRGNQPSKWLTNIPSYTQVTYKNVYPHIDLVVYGNKGQFESDFIVARDTDPSAISLHVDGKVEVGQDGSLMLQSSDGAFQLHRPFVYQLTSNGQRLRVDCRYTIDASNQIGFSLGRYDHSKPLVIDPILSYSTYLGGSGDDSILGVHGDLLGNLYVAGQTTSLNFPTAKPYQSKEAGNSDCFVAKFDPTGQHLIYSTYLGGSGYDRCSGVAVNLLGEAFVGGWTYSADFPTSHPIQASLKGGVNTSNGFVAHLDCTGSKLIFSTYLGGGGEFLTDIALDIASNVYVAGVTNSLNFPVTAGAYQTVCKSSCLTDGFLSKLSADGSRLMYSTYLGGSTYDSIQGVAVDFGGSAYVTGETHSIDFPTKNAYQSKLAGTANAFITKFTPDGSGLLYSTYVGGSIFDSGRSIAVDLFGNAYVTGSTSSLNFPTVNAFQTQNKSNSPIGVSSIFVLQLNNSGSALNYSTYIGGTGYDYPFHISVDLVGTASVVGETTSKDFPLKSPLQSVFGGGNLDAVVVNFATNGTLNYATYLGGSGDDYGFAVYSDLFGCVWVGGTTYSTNFPVQNAFQGNPARGAEGFLSRLTPQF
jgi:hypothetical protein